MLDALRQIGQSGSLLLLGLALGGAWMMAIVAPNVAHDRYDDQDANADVRAMLQAGSPQLGFVLLAATAFSVLAGHFVAAAASLLAAFGFFTNRWTLASHKQDQSVDESTGGEKTQRVVAVAFSLIFSVMILIAALLALAGL